MKKNYEKGFRSMRRLLLVCTILAAVLAAGTASAAQYHLGGGTRWLTEGEGYAQKGSFVRVSVENSGWFKFDSYISGDVEVLRGYSFYAELDLTELNIGAWSHGGTYVYDTPYVVPADFSPTVNDPFELPPIKVDGLTYHFKLTSEASGSITIGGTLDVDVVGELLVSSFNGLAKEGYEIPWVDSKSGCSVGAAACAIVALAVLRRRRSC